MWRLVLKYWYPTLARKLGIHVSDTEVLHVLLQAIDHKIPNRNHYPDWSKEAFLKQLPQSAMILDVGCGNNSPQFTKGILPHCHYVGLDVGNYNQDSPESADEYIIVPPERFAAKIEEFVGTFDAVISSHNLEHCTDRATVLNNMLKALKPGGALYLSFPSADSMRFPNRAGTLNYQDDLTHQDTPPSFGTTVATISDTGCIIEYASSRYQPALRWLIGLYHEAQSAQNQLVDVETWAFWGFESVIWARKPLS